MLLSHHEVTEHTLLPLAELQPEGNLFGAGIHGERITPEKGGGDQVIDATLADSEGQCFVICSVSGLNPKMQDTSHQSRQANIPVSLSTYRRCCGSLRTKITQRLLSTPDLGNLGVTRQDFICSLVV